MHTYWYLGRSAGFVSYWMLWSIVLLGLVVRSRLLDGWLHRGWLFEFHRFLSLFVLLVITFHALIMLPDPYAQFSVRELLLPFQSHLQNTAMALGIIALYGAAFVTGSFYLRSVIGQRAWRLLHYLTFGVYVLSLAHALMNGTDSGDGFVLATYYLSLVVLLFLVSYRLLATRTPLDRRVVRPQSSGKPVANS